MKSFLFLPLAVAAIVASSLVAYMAATNGNDTARFPVNAPDHKNDACFRF